MTHDDYDGMVVLVVAAGEVVVMEEEDTFLPNLSLQLNFCYNWTIQTTHLYVGTLTLSYNLDKHSADQNIYQINKYHHTIKTGYIFSKLYIVLEMIIVKYCKGLTEICKTGNVLICCKHLLCTYYIFVSQILHTMTRLSLSTSYLQTSTPWLASE